MTSHTPQQQDVDDVWRAAGGTIRADVRRAISEGGFLAFLSALRTAAPAAEAAGAGERIEKRIRDIRDYWQRIMDKGNVYAAERVKAIDEVLAAVVAVRALSSPTPVAAAEKAEARSVVAEVGRALDSLDAKFAAKFGSAPAAPAGEVERLIRHWCSDPVIWGTHGQPSEAKLSRLETDILALLSSSRAAIRREAFEEAKQVADAHFWQAEHNYRAAVREDPFNKTSNHSGLLGARTEAENIVKELRALADKEKG